MFKIFEIRSFIILLLCFQRIASFQKLNAQYKSTNPEDKRYDFEQSNSPRKYLRSVIETKRLSFDIPVLKSELYRIDTQENEIFLATETELVNQENSDRTLYNFIVKINERINKFQNQQYKQNEDLKEKLEMMIEKHNSFELLVKSYAETYKSSLKTSSDHSRLHDEHLNCLQNCTNVVTEDGSCSELNKDGAFIFEITNIDLKPFYAYCRPADDDSAWMVIQRREDGSINFNRGWYDYKHGFGDVYGEYWIGLERLHALTSSRKYELKIELEDFENSKRNAKYSKFYIASEDEGYKLELGVYSGNAIDSFSQHNNLKFTTYDRDNDNSVRNCAQKFKGGWWYHDCYNCNLNGEYFSYSDKSIRNSGVAWLGWKPSESLSRVIMLIRPLSLC